MVICFHQPEGLVERNHL